MRDRRGERVPSWSLDCREVNLDELFAALEIKFGDKKMEQKATAKRSVPMCGALGTRQSVESSRR